MPETKHCARADAGLRCIMLIVLLLAMPVSLAALASAIGLLRLPYELLRIDRAIPITFRLHMATAGAALVLMPVAIAAEGWRVHKVLGRTAALLGILGGVTALPVALASGAPFLARAGFGAQGLAWIVVIALAVAAIRRGDRTRHRGLMLTATAIATGAIWLRLVTWAAVATGAPFDTVYAIAAWLAWLMPAAMVAWATRPYRARPRAWPHLPIAAGGGQMGR